VKIHVEKETVSYLVNCWY